MAQVLQIGGWTWSGQKGPWSSDPPSWLAASFIQGLGDGGKGDGLQQGSKVHPTQ